MVGHAGRLSLRIEDQAAAKRAKSWLVELALPLWATAGFDPESGLFRERLALDGGPIANIPHRLMVQARQIYVFSEAGRQGWFPDGVSLAVRVARQVITAFYRADKKPGWVNSIYPGGDIADDGRDLYSHAFILFALSFVASESGDHDILSFAQKTWDFIDQHFRVNGGEGFADRLTADGLPFLDARRQNPHMHLLESLLAFHRADPNAQALVAATGLVDLFHRRFFQPDTGILVEYFDTALRPQTGERGRIFEPGHHFEWAWLLARHADLAGCDASLPVSRLIATASRFGPTPDGALFAEMRDDGMVVNPARRVWPLTEAIKAAVAAGELSLAPPVPGVAAAVAALFRLFLEPAIPGGWIDQRGADGKPSVGFMPASTLYHLVLAFQQLDQAAKA